MAEKHGAAATNLPYEQEPDKLFANTRTEPEAITATPSFGKPFDARTKQRKTPPTAPNYSEAMARSGSW